MITAEKIIQLLTNRTVFYKQFNSNRKRAIRYNLDRINLKFMVAFVVIVLAYLAINESFRSFITTIMVIGILFGLLVFIYLAVRNQAYTKFLNNSKQLKVTHLSKVTEGKFRAMYCPQENKIADLLIFCQRNTNLQKNINYFLNYEIPYSRYRAPHLVEAERQSYIKAINTEIVAQYQFEVIFVVNGWEDKIVILENVVRTEKNEPVDITLTYQNFYEWSKLKVMKVDVPWLMARVLVISIGIATALLIIAATLGWV